MLKYAESLRRSTAPEGFQEHPLEIVVIFTDVPRTLQALKTAAELAQNLDGRIRLLVFEVVPYPLPLECPVVPQNFNQKRFRTIACQCSIEARVELCLCRDREDALRLLPPESLIIIGAHRSWWPRPEKALAGKLHGEKHHVILAYGERKNA